MQSNKPDLFDLLNTWSKLLPKEGEYNATSAANLHKVGNEIKQICAAIEQNGGFLLESATPQEKIKTEEQQKKTEAVYKPIFMFQLEHDTAINPASQKFKCVYDFCQALEEHCQNSPNGHLNIEKDWLKLILSCSSHNYERFMWIHTTFQVANNLNLDWHQVKKRLMCKYDDPSRHVSISHEIANFKFIPELETIEMANTRMNRLTDEAQINVVDSYIHGLPSSVQNVLISTIAYDNTTSFQPDLKDVQQRAVVFVNAKEGDYIFYSKSAHVALCLEHTKVNQKECEFHMLQDHSTTTCPDYTIVRYPYMSFTPLAYVSKPADRVLAIIAPSFVSKSNGVGVTQQSPPKMNGTVNGSMAQPTEKEVNHTTQKSTVTEVASPSPVIGSMPSSLTAVTTNASAESQKTNGVIGLKQAQAVGNMATNMTTNAIATASLNTSQSMDDDIANLTILQAVNRAKELAEKGQELPEALKLRIIQIKAQMSRNLGNPSSNTPVASSTPPTHTQQQQQLQAAIASPVPTPRAATHYYYGESSSSSSSSSRIPHRPISPPRRRSISPNSSSRYGKRRSRSPSPPYYRGSARHRSRSPTDDGSSLSEIGCYYHGINATHTTKGCHIEIKRRRSSTSPPSQPLASASARRGNRGGGGQVEEENICIFCHLPFKPGHLGYCTEVRSRKLPRR